jgi:hypothetical protein
MLLSHFVAGTYVRAILRPLRIICNEKRMLPLFGMRDTTRSSDVAKVNLRPGKPTQCPRRLTDENAQRDQ